MTMPPGWEPGPAPPSTPPVGWEERLRLRRLLNLQNPTLTMNAPTNNKEDKKQQDDDEKKKLDRIAAIKAKRKKKSKGKKTSISSGSGTVSPILYSYGPTSLGEDTSSRGFSFSDIPSVVWIVLAVAGGMFMVKSAGKRR